MQAYGGGTKIFQYPRVSSFTAVSRRNEIRRNRWTKDSPQVTNKRLGPEDRNTEI